MLSIEKRDEGTKKCPMNLAICLFFFFWEDRVELTVATSSERAHITWAEAPGADRLFSVDQFPEARTRTGL
jgi:hypothetical protein